MARAESAPCASSCSGDHGKRIVSWSLRDVPDAPMDGLVTTVSERPAAEPALHPNGVQTIDHLVVLSPDLDRTVTAFEAAGLEVRRTRIVDPSQNGFEARQVFFRLGEVVLELIGPDEPYPEAADRTAGFFGLAFTVADLDVLADRFGDHIGAIKEAVQPGRRIATLRHKDVGLSVATAFMTPGPDALGFEEADQ